MSTPLGLAAKTVSGSSINVQNPLSAPYRTGCYLVYDIDYIAADAPEAATLRRVVPLWLDVMQSKHPFMPIFNVQRGFGHYDPKFKRKVCIYPKERCAAAIRTRATSERSLGCLAFMRANAACCGSKMPSAK